MYGNFFSIKKIKLTLKDLKNPWIKPEIRRSSKRKQRLYHKCLKNRIPKNERDYNIKMIKYSLKQLKSAIKLCFSNLIIKCKTNIRITLTTWQFIKNHQENNKFIVKFPLKSVNKKKYYIY